MPAVAVLITTPPAAPLVLGVIAYLSVISFGVQFSLAKLSDVSSIGVGPRLNLTFLCHANRPCSFPLYP